jgi:hypothetical protein
VASAICPNYTLLTRPIFAEAKAANDEMPGATPEELAQAIPRILNRPEPARTGIINK